MRGLSRAGPLDPAEIEAVLLPWLSDAEGTPAILAVSGGPDSICLMRSAARLKGTRPLIVATVDHGLREGSAAEAAQVSRWAAEAGLPHRILMWEGAKPKARLQEAARAERYRLLAGLAHEIGAGCILTAHTLDDQAETILLRFLKGSGLSGLKGMSERREIGSISLARPFLGIRKSRLVATCRAEGWPFVEDPSNADSRFARARLRRSLPDLEREGFSPERFAVLARRLARADAALEAQAEAAFGRLASGVPGAVEIETAGLAALPEEIAMRVIARAVAQAVPGGPAMRLAALERLMGRLLGGGPGGTIAGAEVVRRENGKLLVRPEPPRRRGRYPKGEGAPSSGRADDAAPPHSLGKG